MGPYLAQRQELYSVTEDHPVAPPKALCAGAETGPGGQTLRPTLRRRAQCSCWSIAANRGPRPNRGRFVEEPYLSSELIPQQHQGSVILHAAPASPAGGSLPVPLPLSVGLTPGGHLVSFHLSWRFDSSWCECCSFLTNAFIFCLSVILNAFESSEQSALLT